jgi:hypothetical protein
MSFNAQAFSDGCYTFFAYFLVALGVFMALWSMVGIELMRRTQGWKNTALLLLLFAILVYSITGILYWITYTLEATTDSVSLAADNVCHWVITQTYFLTAYQTRMLLDPKTYVNSVA